MQRTNWILTIPAHEFTPFLPESCRWIRGQLEVAESGFVHWQIAVGFLRNVRLARVRQLFGPFHAEPIVSVEDARAYVHKVETAIVSTRFDLGKYSGKGVAAVGRDWDGARRLAELGQFAEIPSDLFIRYYGNFQRIFVASSKPVDIVRDCTVFWGATGTGKSRTAIAEAGPDRYIKDARTKWWNGYENEKNVIIDEFRGAIDIGHLLVWLDRYAVRVELKYSTAPLFAERFWICSNLSPREWYPDVDPATFAAFERRLTVVKHFVGVQDFNQA
nr:MAG: replication associated protein [Cressdnaviricota sp.]